MKASLLLMALLCLHSSFLRAQEAIVIPPVVVIEPPPTPPPAPINITTPIDIEIPVYQKREALPVRPVEEVQKIYTSIKDSEFFFEINPLRLNIGSMDFQSDNQDAYDRPDLELDISATRFKMMPLDFKFGFENTGWGAFAEVYIGDDSNSSQLVVYSKAGVAKIGAGLRLDLNTADAKVKSNGSVVGKGEAESTEISPYFYLAFDLVNSESMVIQQWTKIGGSYEDAEISGLKARGISFFVRPAIDFMFKINSKLQIGTGIEFEYERYKGKIEDDKGAKFSGVGNTFVLELNLIKTKFLF